MKILNEDTRSYEFPVGDFSIIYAHVRAKEEVEEARHCRDSCHMKKRKEADVKPWFGIEIAPQDSQTDRINANNWILPAISVSFRAARRSTAKRAQTTTTTTSVGR